MATSWILAAVRERWALIVGLALVASCGGGGDTRAQAPPGTLKCTGSGSPTVILESGLGVDPATTWAAVIPDVARGARVCVHQRPGTAGVAPIGHSRTAAAVESELEQLLDAEHVRGPLVVVGASFGGYVARLFADRRPDDVSGVVLVDSLHPDIDSTFARLFGERATAARARQLADNTEGITFDDLVASAHEVAASRGFPDVPLVVLKHGISFDPGGEPVPKLERAWARMQRELARLSPDGRLIVAERSHHRIAEDQPRLVAAAIERVIRG
jgi:pimeloyl-ACP methyl ester carboxylesterase